MKIKVNLENETVSIKGLTPVQFALIETLVSHVRLGDGTEASDAAFKILKAIEQEEDLDFIEKVEISLGATTDDLVECLELWLDGPTLVACEEDSDEDFDDGGPYNEHPKSAWPFFAGPVVHEDGDEPTCGGCNGCDCGDD
jgi:hypothetical protein